MTSGNQRPRWSRRRRYVVVTSALLLLAMAIGAGVLVHAQRKARIAEYRPGEADSDITESLARDLPPDAPRPVFVDVTAQAGLADFKTFAGTRTSQLPEDMGPGVAWGDYDNDGDDDLFIVSAGGPLGVAADQLAPSALFENLGDGRFRRVTDFPEPRIHGMAAAWGDYDGDGWVDLVVTGFDTLILFHNDHGHFARDLRFQNRTGFWAGAAWGDYDNDGRLDLYVCGYVEYVPPTPGQRTTVSREYGRAAPFTLNPASYAPARNLLFHNTGRGVLVETAARLGVANPEGRSLSALWHDFDDDGWLDLYVANDISDNVLYRNVHGRFTDISHPAWVGDYRGAMGLAAGDWNRDGDDDLFITHWIAQENALYDSLLKDSSSGLHFVDAADSVGLGQIALPVVGWGTEFFDFDNDGWLDLVVANGSTFESEDNPRRLVPQKPFLFWNRRGEHFFDLAPLVPALARAQVGRGLAVSDFDGDGDLDVLIARSGEGVQLLRNDTIAGRSVEVVLKRRGGGNLPATQARGATATGRLGSAILRRSATSASYLSQSTSVLHFGLGTAAQLDAFTVRWRPGVSVEYGALAAGRRWEITEGDASPREVTALLSRTNVAASAPTSDRLRTIEFWECHRSGMQALKAEHNPQKAASLFEQALAIDPSHEDARYYLAIALATQGAVEDALHQLAELTRLNPNSHRGHAGWARLRALTSRRPADLAAAQEALTRARHVNPEESGVLLMMAEVALLQRQPSAADRHLRAVAQMNARSPGALFLLGYVRWKSRDLADAREYLERLRAALGPEWKPSGATAEGDTAIDVGQDTTILSRFWQRWDGRSDPKSAYQVLDRYLSGRP